MSDRSSMAATWTMPSSSLDEIRLGVSPLEKTHLKVRVWRDRETECILEGWMVFFWMFLGIFCSNEHPWTIFLDWGLRCQMDLWKIGPRWPLRLLLLRNRCLRHRCWHQIQVSVWINRKTCSSLAWWVWIPTEIILSVIFSEGSSCLSRGHLLEERKEDLYDHPMANLFRHHWGGIFNTSIVHLLFWGDWKLRCCFDSSGCKKNPELGKRILKLEGFSSNFSCLAVAGAHTAMRFDGWTFEQNTRLGQAQYLQDMRSGFLIRSQHFEGEKSGLQFLSRLPFSHHASYLISSDTCTPEMICFVFLLFSFILGLWARPISGISWTQYTPIFPNAFYILASMRRRCFACSRWGMNDPQLNLAAAKAGGDERASFLTVHAWIWACLFSRSHIFGYLSGPRVNHFGILMGKGKTRSVAEVLLMVGLPRALDWHRKRHRL